ncbi:hypothetical protein ERJ75_001303700 [Trypanosoma vivax]|nr:hypothetical protein ERJ75_001303700 [Trypanosoma vivax]
MKRFWTSLLGFASLLALLSANKAQGHAAKGVKRSSAQGACSFATALDAVASAAELAATEAAERSANASAWQEALATALSKTNNATAVDALGTAAALQSMNAQVGAVALRLAREAAAWAVDIRSAVFAFSALSGGGSSGKLCISKQSDNDETAAFSQQDAQYAFDAICEPETAAVEALAKDALKTALKRCSQTETANCRTWQKRYLPQATAGHSKHRKVQQRESTQQTRQRGAGLPASRLQVARRQSQARRHHRKDQRQRENAHLGTVVASHTSTPQHGQSPRRARKPSSRLRNHHRHQSNSNVDKHKKQARGTQNTHCKRAEKVQHSSREPLRTNNRTRPRNTATHGHTAKSTGDEHKANDKKQGCRTTTQRPPTRTRHRRGNINHLPNGHQVEPRN